MWIEQYALHSVWLLLLIIHHQFASCHISPHRVMSYHIIAHHACQVSPCHVMSYHIMSNHVTPCHIRLCHICEYMVRDFPILARMDTRIISSLGFNDEFVDISVCVFRYLLRRDLGDDIYTSTQECTMLNEFSVWLHSHQHF